MWTEQHRKTYERAGGRYPSDFTRFGLRVVFPCLSRSKFARFGWVWL
jgi:hypothetical protein